MKLEIKRCTFEELYAHPEWSDWVKEYVKETANPVIGIADAQVDRYRETYAAGRLRCLKAVDGEHLAGAAMLCVTVSHHYPFPIIGLDALYLRKSWRKDGNGLALMREIRRSVAEEGAPGCPVMAPPNSRLDRICQAYRMPHTHNCYWMACDE